MVFSRRSGNLGRGRTVTFLVGRFRDTLNIWIEFSRLVWAIN